MRKHLKTSDVWGTVVAVSAVAIFGLLAGCRSNAGSESHAMSSELSEYEVKCRLCYDETVRVRRAVPGKASAGVSRYTYISKHMCPDCKATSDINKKAGWLAFKCKGCVPEGVLCNRCVFSEKG